MAKCILARCKKCGGYILIQHSEFHSAIEEEFPGKYIIYDDGGIRVGWKRGNR